MRPFEDLIASIMIHLFDFNASMLSVLSPVKLGVPQGSMVGQFWFVVYLNDLPFFLKGISVEELFVDDTSLIFKVNRSRNGFNVKLYILHSVRLRIGSSLII